MKKTILLLLCAVSISMYPQSLMVANFEDNGTDKMCEKRILEQITSGTPEAKIEFGVINPQKIGINTSEKVMKLSDIKNGGIINLNLLGYDANTQLDNNDKIRILENTFLSYDKLRLKYYLAGTNNPLGANLLPRMELHYWTANPQPALKYWTNPIESSTTWSDWNEITFDIVTTLDQHGRIMIFTYPSWSQAIVEGLTIYIDDIELIEVKTVEEPEPTGSLMVANFENNGTDEMCEKRITEEANGSKIRVSNNPKVTTANSSGKVLEIYDIKQGGMIDINLLGYWNSGLVGFSNNDRIQIDDNGLPLYDKIRMKYYVENADKNKLDGVKIQLLGPTVNPADKEWKNTLETSSTWTDWNTVTFDLGMYSACERIILFSYIDWSGSIQDGVKIYIDDIEFINSSAGHTIICPVKDNRQGILTITMDDGYPISSEYYERQFVANDLRGTTVLISNWLNNSASSKQSFQELLTRGRFEYGSHSKSHPVSAPNNEVSRQSEIVTSKSELTAMFPMQRILTFTLYNGVTYEGANMDLAKATYQAMRGGNRGYNSLLPTENEMYPLKIQGVLDSETVSNMNTWIDVAVSKKQWLIEMWHAIKEYDPVSYAPPTEAVATAHLEYIGAKQKEGLLWVATFDEAVQYVKECRTATVVDNGLEENPRKITLTDTLDDNLFSYPLTLRSEVPSDWTYVQVEQGGNIQQMVSVEKSGKRYVYYNTVPDRGDITLAEGYVPGSDISQLSISKTSAGNTVTGRPIEFTANTTSDENDGSIEWFVNGVRQFTVGKTFSFTPSIIGLYGVITKATSPATFATVYSNVVDFSVTQGQSALPDNSYSDIDIYTNDNSIYLKSFSTEIKNINVYNLYGQIIYSKNINNGSCIINNLESGLYFIKLMADKGIISSRKVLID